MTVRLAPGVAEAIRAAAEAAYPEECCGLLVGRRDGGNDEVDADVTVTRAVASANVLDGDRRRGFEVDPKVRFDVMRALENDADGRDIVGHYHSHPDHPAEPSARDREMAFEPAMVWLIVGVPGGRADAVNAFAVTADGFRPLPMTPADDGESA